MAMYARCDLFHARRQIPPCSKTNRHARRKLPHARQHLSNTKNNNCFQTLTLRITKIKVNSEATESMESSFKYTSVFIYLFLHNIINLPHARRRRSPCSKKRSQTHYFGILSKLFQLQKYISNFIITLVHYLHSIKYKNTFQHVATSPTLEDVFPHARRSGVKPGQRAKTHLLRQQTRSQSPSQLAWF